MLEDAITNEGLLKPEILNDLYDEALELSSSIVGYLGANKNESLKGIGVELMSYYTLECNRMTTGVMQAMSWCLMQKGVSNGEMSVKDAREKKSRLSNNQLFGVPIGCDTDRLLYDGGVLEENPVHRLINKIENNS